MTPPERQAAADTFRAAALSAARHVLTTTCRRGKEYAFVPKPIPESPPCVSKPDAR
ncbi:hypothetical protein VARIO8X_160216 [Burkholderiales bacterium 8X]|nr:hypothetical protein VARIO8X_160216 [Burkholderiales bacterium 8X]